MITIYHNPRCGKSRKALESVKAKGESYRIVEYLKDTPSIAELSSLVAQLGISPKQLIRTKEPIFIEKFKDKAYDDAQWLEVLHEYPILIERPIIVRDACAVVARTDEALAKVMQ